MNVSSRSMGEKPWSSLERICLSLLQQKNSRPSLLQIHAFILRNALETNAKLVAKFISAGASLPLAAGLIRHALHVFDKSPHRRLGDSFLCNSAIKAHSDAGQFAESFALYRDLRRDAGFVPDGYTFLVLAKACGSNMAYREGVEVHNHVVKKGFCSNLYVVTALVDMYAEFGRRIGDMTGSRKLFDDIEERDSAVYNAMIDGYAKVGDMSAARDLFNETKERNVVSWTSMIYGYCYDGDLESARSLFDAMPEKNLVSWNAMISGYCRNKQPHEALKLFNELQAKTLLEPDEVTILSILPGIADLGALDLGRWVHRFVQRKRFDKLTNICTALVDMYTKCGEVSEAKRIFDELPNKEVASWNAMINGFAVNGCGEEALKLFLEMQYKNFTPNQVTFLGVLSACNHSGLVEEGNKWFKAMAGFSVVPQIKHYGCMVDLLGKAGFLDEAEKLIENMPYKANGVILSSFLSSCGYFKDFKRAQKFIESAVKLEPWNDGNYITVRNLYAKEQKWTNAEEIKRLMKNNGANKEIGCSVIEVDGTILEFVCGNRLYHNWDRIDLTLEWLRLHMKGNTRLSMLEEGLF